MTPAQAIAQLRTGKGNLRCKDVKRLLEDLGFEVRDGKRGGHKIVVHDGLDEFTSASFNCGHGKNPEIKPAYITNLIRMISDHEAELTRYLSGGGHHD